MELDCTFTDEIFMTLNLDRLLVSNEEHNVPLLWIRLDSMFPLCTCTPLKAVHSIRMRLHVEVCSITAILFEPERQQLLHGHIDVTMQAKCFPLFPLAPSLFTSGPASPYHLVVRRFQFCQRYRLTAGVDWRYSSKGRFVARASCDIGFA
ncbi:Hypothetical predicted protein [Scomber scombrus]|uniref:Uncharacterized protein n=1 Tax=Scomber scombrus TaxID=13677 RepID=A0AAV1PCY2_SCOSC